MYYLFYSLALFDSKVVVTEANWVDESGNQLVDESGNTLIFKKAA